MASPCLIHTGAAVLARTAVSSSSHHRRVVHDYASPRITPRGRSKKQVSAASAVKVSSEETSFRLQRLWGSKSAFWISPTGFQRALLDAAQRTRRGGGDGVTVVTLIFQ